MRSAQVREMASCRDYGGEVVDAAGVAGVALVLSWVAAAADAVVDQPHSSRPCEVGWPWQQHFLVDCLQYH